MSSALVTKRSGNNKPVRRRFPLRSRVSLVAYFLGAIYDVPSLLLFLLTTGKSEMCCRCKSHTRRRGSVYISHCTCPLFNFAGGPSGYFATVGKHL